MLSKHVEQNVASDDEDLGLPSEPRRPVPTRIQTRRAIHDFRGKTKNRGSIATTTHQYPLSPIQHGKWQNRTNLHWTSYQIVPRSLESQIIIYRSNRLVLDCGHKIQHSHAMSPH